MALDGTSQLAETLASTANTTSDLSQNLSADDSTGLLQINFTGDVGIEHNVQALRKVYDTQSFILDHRTQGVLDSSSLYIDGGYRNYGPSINLALDLTTQATPTVNDLGMFNNDGTVAIKATGYYPFNANANDASTTGNNGTVTSATLTTDHLGNANNAYNFATNAANINLGASVTMSADTTVAGWIKYSGSTGYIALFNKWAGSYTNFLLLDLNQATGLLRLDVRNAGVGSTVNSTTAITQNTWAHIAVVLSGTTYTFYVNGVAAGTGTLPASTLPSFAGTTYIGYRADLTSYEWQGDISEILIMACALTASEISHLYTVTSSHKLDKPLVTRTDTDGNTITGYEMTGKPSLVSGAGQLWGTQVNLPNLLIDANVTQAYYCKFYLAPQVTDSVDYFIGGTTNTANSLGLGNFDNTAVTTVNFGQDDTFLASTVSPTRGKVYQVYASYSYDSGTPANSAWTLVLADADGTVLSTNTQTGYDAYGSVAQYVGYETRFGRTLRGVITQPIIFDRILTTQERTDLFAGEYTSNKILYEGAY